MKVFEYLLYRFHSHVQKYKDDTWWRCYTYMSFLFLWISWGAFALLKGTVDEILKAIGNAHYATLYDKLGVVWVLTATFLPFVYVFFRFFAWKDIGDYYTVKYQKSKLNAYFKTWFLVPIFLFVMVFSFFPFILCFGGYAFGHDYNGILSPLIHKAVHAVI